MRALTDPIQSCLRIILIIICGLFDDYHQSWTNTWTAFWICSEGVCGIKVLGILAYAVPLNWNPYWNLRWVLAAKTHCHLQTRNAGINADRVVISHLSNPNKSCAGALSCTCFYRMRIQTNNGLCYQRENPAIDIIRRGPRLPVRYCLSCCILVVLSKCGKW